MKQAIVPIIVTLALAGCGGSSSKPKTTTASDPLGAATGTAFVHSYDRAKDKAANIMANDFVLWVSGKATNAPGNPPAAPLSAPERHAAAAVVLRYAQKLVSKGELSPNLPNGQTVLAYLRANGVK